MFGSLGRLASAILYGVIVFVVVVIIALLCKQFGLAAIGDVLEKFAPILAILGAIVAYLGGTNGRPLL